MELKKVFTFEAAHQLPNVPVGHQCGRIHGHTYRVELTLAGNRKKDMGWVMDFAEVTSAWQRICDIWLEHRFLNEMPGLSNPTAENLCWFLFDALFPTLPQLTRVDVWETARSMAGLGLLEYEVQSDKVEPQDMKGMTL